MPNELPTPPYPQALQDILRAFDKPRHPFLAQGMLHQYWHDPRWPKEERQRGTRIEVTRWNKERESQKQAENCNRLFAGNQHGDSQGGIIRQMLPERQLTLKPSHSQSEVFTASAPLLVGVGLPNPLENGITLHPLYGLPYLPGSAIKGIAQHYVLQRWATEAGIMRLPADKVKAARAARKLTPLDRFELALMAADDEPNGENETIETWTNRCQQVTESLTTFDIQPDEWETWHLRQDSRIKGKLFVRLFGSPRRQGRVIYLDAFPNHVTMGTDVVTPHHSTYYTRQTAPPPPADWDEPTPNQYLVIAAGTTFQITVMAMSDSDRDLLPPALKLIELALQDRGMGAKTGVGYGRFSP